MTPPVAVLGCGAFVTRYPGLAGWSEGRTDPELEQPKATIVPARQRRRASLLSRAMADAYAEAVGAAGLDVATVASVFGSALGEATTMIELLNQMWDEQAMLSPMRFATSVHNAASGLISIATQNRGFTTSIGADYDTPAMALLEGIAWVLAHDEPVVICCGDEAPPPDLVPGDSGWALLTAAIAIGPVASAPSRGPRLSKLAVIDPLRQPAPPLLDPHEVPKSLRQNPNIGLLDLVVACARKQRGVLRLDRGAGRGFAIEITDPIEAGTGD